MTSLDWLKLAYAANVVILVPVALPTLLGLYDTTQGTIPESSGYRSLVGALWTSILVASVLGMWTPLRYVPVLMMQVIYKSLWLLLYALPALRRKKPVPLGITISFAAIALLWPWLIPWHLLIRD